MGETMSKTEKILLAILALVVLIVVVLVTVIYLPRIIEKSQTLPPHELRAVLPDTNNIWLIIYADKQLSQSDALRIASYYDSKYKSYSVFNLDFFCDSEHATENFHIQLAKSEISPDQYFSFVKFSYMRTNLRKIDCHGQNLNACLWTSEEQGWISICK
jgi:hypothetical protein